MELKFEPNSLLGAVWLQFALAISGDKHYRQCPGCQNFFEVSPSVRRDDTSQPEEGDDSRKRRKRVDRSHCDNACRSSAYRQRKAKAKRLHGQGLEIDEIAGELDTNPEQIKKWVASRR